MEDLALEIERMIPSSLLPEGDTKSLFRLYALLALVKGVDVSARDVHNAWAVWMLETDPSHRSIKPFEELDPDTQQSDVPFLEAIRTAAERRGLSATA